MTTLDQSTGKNRYLTAPKHADFTLDQDWASYSAAEHDRWDRLFARALADRLTVANRMVTVANA